MSKLPTLDLRQIDWPAFLSKYVPNEFLNLDAGGQLTKRRSACPVCNDGEDRFLFSNYKNTGGSWCNQCRAINPFKLLNAVRGMSKAEVMAALKGDSCMKPIMLKEKTAEQLQIEKDAEIARQKSLSHSLNLTWEKLSVKLTPDCAAGRYLKSRVPNLDFMKLGYSLRFAPKIEYREYGTNVSLGVYPALISLMKSSDCQYINLHRTYLSEAGSKANVPSVKKLKTGIRKLDGAAIRLSKRNDAIRTLAITEGIETGLAVLAAHNYSVHVWSLYSAVNLGVADIPTGRFDKVVIYADHDKCEKNFGCGTGEHYAKLLKTKLESMGMMCEITMPSNVGEDFADLYLRGEKFALANGEKYE